FINMVSDICEAVGADVVKVARGIGLDPRIGTGFLSAGIGFGGYCFPKDLRAFAYLGEEHGADCGLLREVERINQRRIELDLRKVRGLMEVPVIIDGRNIYEPSDARNAGFEYHSMGREAIVHHADGSMPEAKIARRKPIAPLTKPVQKVKAGSKFQPVS